jgi:hypothetical protein
MGERNEKNTSTQCLRRAVEYKKTDVTLKPELNLN